MTKTSAFSARLGLEVLQPVKMNLLHPATGEALVHKETGESAYILITNLNSPEVQAFTRRKNDEAKKSNAKPSEAETDAAFRERVAYLIKGWSIVDFDGETVDVAYSPEEASNLVNDPAMYWVLQQIMAFVTNDANFLRSKASA